jgi:hypothetical protein
MTIQNPRPADAVSETDLTGFAAARWLAANEPARRAQIDASARVAFERFRAGGPDWVFIAALNRLRGRCADGCCGGPGEYAPGAAPEAEVQIDAYVTLLMRRGLTA